MDATKIAATTREYAAELADFYRANPTKWKQGEYGDLRHGCCMSGGFSGLYTQKIGPMSIPANLTIAGNLFRDLHAKFLEVNGRSIVAYNDDVCKTVDDAIVALRRVAAA